MTTMTREEAIRAYVEKLSGSVLAYLLQYIDASDGSFEESNYYDMDLFDEFMSNDTPSEIAKMIYFGGEFNPNDAYFRFNGYGNLESFNWRDVVAEAEGLKDDIIDHLVTGYSGDTPWTALDNLVNATANAIFDEDFNEVDDDDDDDDE